MKKYIKIAVAVIFIISAGFGIHFYNQSKIMVTPLNKDVQSVTYQEYSGNEPVNEELEISHDKSYSPDNYYFGTGYTRVLLKKNIPARGTSLKYVITCDDGTETICYEYCDEENTYMELPGKGVYSHSNQWNGFEGTLESYRDKLYGAYYKDKAESKSFSLVEGYTGAGKAIYINVDGTDWWDRCIPEEYKSSTPLDVRYVIVPYVLSKTYAGYYYVVGTGEKVSDSYDYTYSLSGFDLLTGEETVIIESTDDIFDVTDSEIIKSYLDRQN